MSTEHRTEKSRLPREPLHSTAWAYFECRGCGADIGIAPQRSMRGFMTRFNAMRRKHRLCWRWRRKRRLNA